MKREGDLMMTMRIIIRPALLSSREKRIGGVTGLVANCIVVVVNNYCWYCAFVAVDFGEERGVVSLVWSVVVWFLV